MPNTEDQLWPGPPWCPDDGANGFLAEKGPWTRSEAHAVARRQHVFGSCCDIDVESGMIQLAPQHLYFLPSNADDDQCRWMPEHARGRPIE